MTKTDPHPFRVSHRPVPPLGARDARLKQAARISGALVDRGELDPRHPQKLGQGDGERPIDMTAHGDAIALNVDRGRDVGPVPANEETVVGVNTP